MSHGVRGAQEVRSGEALERLAESKLPVLVLDGVPIHGSATIIAEVERRRPDPPPFPEAVGEAPSSP